MAEFRKSSLPFLLICSLIIHAVSAANDTMNSSQIIRDGETLVSSGGMFELGFFSTANSMNRYVGIWYKNITVRTYVWVANGQAPLINKSGVLKVTQPGILALFDNTNGTIVWSSNATQTVGNPAAQLLDTGNLVVKDANDDRPENFVWQSFIYPSDSCLSGMSFGWNFVTGVETYFTSWRSDNDPSPGVFTSHLDPTGYPQIVQRRLGVIQSRVGPWNGVRFSGAPGARSNPTMRVNKNEVMYMEESEDPSVVARLRLSPDGSVDRWTWNYETNSWAIYDTTPDVCDHYNTCGANGICSVEKSPHCGCLDRFVPKDRERSKECVRRTPLKCQDDVFVKYSGIKLPDARYAWYNDQRLMLSDCEDECAKNCSCTAYAQLDIREEEGGCLFYYGDFIDIKALDQEGGDLYIRIASTELVEDHKGGKKVIIIASVTSVVVGILLCIIVILFYVQKRKRKGKNKKGPFNGSDGEESELPFFNKSTILKATDNFSIVNKLGHGGFGTVYKGMLENGQEIAVKRLSETSSQGVDELKNEVLLIAKLQHRNLVRLLGCCIQGEENMLIYEYMPNNSLDSILFDETRSMILDWPKRFNIINGIAKGLLYLHQDSRLRIIHRDLKASNILLDADMNPKISDFGLARSFGGNQTEVQTRRVVGTYGYMSPEYVTDGLFSVKSDVFSFGVLLLEIVSGMRNRGLLPSDSKLNLIRYAWTLYEEDKACELVDASLGNSFVASEVMRSLHVGMLCVQTRPEDRPTMSSVVFMLGNEVALPEAKQPAFFVETQASSTKTNAKTQASSTKTNAASSDNLVTITMPEGR